LAKRLEPGSSLSIDGKDTVMTEIDSDTLPANTTSPVTIAINILSAPSEAFRALDLRPTKLVPLALILVSSAVVLFWYFSIIDFDWYVDDTLAANPNMSAEQLEAARESMLSMSQSTFRIIGIAGSTVSVLLLYLLQAGYLSMASALIGDKYRFSHWFSLICWTNLPYLLVIIGMVVTILLSPNGQISAYDLNPLTLANLGLQAGDSPLQSLFRLVSLNMLWSLGLVVMGYKQWVQSSWVKAAAVVLAPYLLILGIWAFIAFA